MITELQSLRDDYLSWLRDNTLLREVDEWVEITTPFLDRHNDCVQIYAKPLDGGYLLTDHGYTIDDLEFCGCKLDSGTRRELLKITLNGFGVRRKGNALQVDATLEDFALQKQNLLQAVLAVNNLHYTSRSTVASLFADDVAGWLTKSNIRYDRNVNVLGKTGLNIRYDFVIRESGKQPHRVLWAISNPSPDAAKRTAFAWEDTRELHSSNYRAYAMLNDKEKSVPDNVINALRNYEIQPLIYSTPGEAIELLLAA